METRKEGPNHFDIKYFCNSLKSNTITELDLSDLTIPEYESSERITRLKRVLNGKKMLEDQSSMSETFTRQLVLPNGLLALTCERGGIEIWDPSGSFIRSMGKENYICTLATFPEGEIIAGSQDIVIWNPLTAKQMGKLKTKYTYYVSALCVLSDCSFVSSMGSTHPHLQNNEGLIHHWQRSGTELAVLSGHTHRVVCFVVIDKTRFASGSFDHTVKIWNNGQCDLTLQCNNKVFALAFLPDETLASFDASGEINIWNYQTGDKLKTFFHNDHRESSEFYYRSDLSLTYLNIPTHETYVFRPCLAVLPDGRLVSSFRENIRVWDTLSSDVTFNEFPGVKGIYDMTVLPDGRLVCVNHTGEFTVFWSMQRTLKIDDIKLLFNLLKLNTSVTTLNLQNNEIYDLDLHLIIELCTHNKTLKTLQLTNTKVTDAGVGLLRELLQAQNITIQYTAAISDDNELKTLPASPFIGRTPKLEARIIKTLQAHSEELSELFDKRLEDKSEEKQRQTIRVNEKLNEYYNMFIQVVTQSWIACITIHSNRVNDDEVNYLDKITNAMDKFSDYISLPGAKIVSDILSTGIKFKSAQKKRLAVNNIAKFFIGLREGDILIEKLSRKLTFLQETDILKLGTEEKTASTKIRDASKQVLNYLTTNDTDTAAKEFAAEQGRRLLEAIIVGDLPEQTIDLELMCLFSLGKKPLPSPSTHFAFFQKSTDTESLSVEHNTVDEHLPIAEEATPDDQSLTPATANKVDTNKTGSRRKKIKSCCKLL
ncbi:MAG: hypothetical protein ABI597_13220 [Gammaproteobacteria bacterium]